MKQQKNNPPEKTLEDEMMQKQLEKKFSIYKYIDYLTDEKKGSGAMEAEWVLKNGNHKGDYPGFGIDRNSPIIKPLNLRTVTSSTAPGFLGQAPRPDLSVFPGEYSLLETIGAKFDFGNKNDFNIPLESTAAIAAWVTEGSAGGTEPAYLNYALVKPKTLAANIVLTRKFFFNYTPLKDEVIKNRLKRAHDVQIDNAAFFGPGTGGAPTGALSNSDVTKISGASFDNAIANSMIADVKGEDPPLGEGLFLLNPDVEEVLKSRVATAGKFMIQENKLCDQPYLASPRIDTGYVIYLAPSAILVSFFGEIFIHINPFYDNYGSVRINVFQELDLSILQPGWIQIAQNFS